jgi:hypothetical protein
MLYRSASHPDVKAGKRGEEDVLREFLETFGGASFTAGFEGSPQADTGVVAHAGFAAYYALASMLQPHDGAFSTTLYDVFGLYEGSNRGLEAALAPAGGQIGGGTASVGSVLFGQSEEGFGFGRHGVMAGGGASSDAGGQFVGGRGPGQRPLPREAYVSGSYGVAGKQDLTMKPARTLTQGRPGASTLGGLW